MINKRVIRQTVLVFLFVVGLSSNALGFIFSPASELSLAPGEKAAGVLQLSLTSRREHHHHYRHEDSSGRLVRIYLADMQIGQRKVGREWKPRTRSCVSWIGLPERIFNLRYWVTQKIHFPIQVPTSVSPGQYYASLVVEQVKARARGTNSGLCRTELKTRDRMTLPIIIQVAFDGTNRTVEVRDEEREIEARILMSPGQKELQVRRGSRMGLGVSTYSPCDSLFVFYGNLQIKDNWQLFAGYGYGEHDLKYVGYGGLEYTGLPANIGMGAMNSHRLDGLTPVVRTSLAFGPDCLKVRGSYFYLFGTAEKISPHIFTLGIEFRFPLYL